jgi:4-hydroxybenzoate polyprenyltransferase
MILNDWFDIEKDKQQRSRRPLASGAISVGQAGAAGWGLLLLGLLLSCSAAFYFGATASWPVVAWCLGLIAAVVLYDGPLKNTLLAPWLMGLCRGLHWMFAVTLVSYVGGDCGEHSQRLALAIAGIMTLYVTGVTWFARREADKAPAKSLLIFGTLLMTVSLIGLGTMPWWLIYWLPMVPKNSMYAWLVAMSGAILMRRWLTAITNPSPATIQVGVKQSLLSLIMLDAFLAFWWAGAYWSAGIILLVVPALWLGARFRTT